MRILLCSLEAPIPPSNGLRLQVAALMRELSPRHELRVLAFVMPDQSPDRAAAAGMRLLAPPAGARGLRKIETNARSLIARRPRGFEEVVHALREPLADELERFDPDVVHATMGHVAAFRDQLAGRATVVAPLDAWHLNYEAEALAASGPRRYLLRSDVSRMRRFEGTQYRRFHRVVVVSQENADALRRLDPTLVVDVIPNGVDVERFSAPPAAVREPGLVVFTGVMSYGPNVTAAEYLARRVMPAVRAIRADARLAIVGRAPAPRVRALDELDGVEVVGEVPDMATWLSRARAYACPMRSGSGIKNKLLEALANGMPSVVTPRALAGLDVTAGRHLLVGEDEEQLAAHLASVLADDALASRLGGAGREYVEQHHSWAAVGRAYEDVYEQALSAAGRRI